MGFAAAMGSTLRTVDAPVSIKYVCYYRTDSHGEERYKALTLFAQ